MDGEMLALFGFRLLLNTLALWHIRKWGENVPLVCWPVMFVANARRMRDDATNRHSDGFVNHTSLRVILLFCILRLTGRHLQPPM